MGGRNDFDTGIAIGRFYKNIVFDTYQCVIYIMTQPLCFIMFCHLTETLHRIIPLHRVHVSHVASSYTSYVPHPVYSNAPRGRVRNREMNCKQPLHDQQNIRCPPS